MPEVIRNVKSIHTDHTVLRLEDPEGKILKVMPLPSGLKIQGAETTEIIRFRVGMLPKLYAMFSEPASCVVEPGSILVCRREE
jgi:hypothetical protein